VRNPLTRMAMLMPPMGSGQSKTAALLTTNRGR
jgi:hypothetical protein